MSDKYPHVNTNNATWESINHPSSYILTEDEINFIYKIGSPYLNTKDENIFSSTDTFIYKKRHFFKFGLDCIIEGCSKQAVCSLCTACGRITHYNHCFHHLKKYEDHYIGFSRKDAILVGLFEDVEKMCIGPSINKLIPGSMSSCGVEIQIESDLNAIGQSIMNFPSNALLTTIYSKTQLDNDVKFTDSNTPDPTPPLRRRSSIFDGMMSHSVQSSSSKHSKEKSQPTTPKNELGEYRKLKKTKQTKSLRKLRKAVSSIFKKNHAHDDMCQNIIDSESDSDSDSSTSTFPNELCQRSSDYNSFDDYYEAPSPQASVSEDPPPRESSEWVRDYNNKSSNLYNSYESLTSLHDLSSYELYKLYSPSTHFVTIEVLSGQQLDLSYCKNFLSTGVLKGTERNISIFVIEE